MTAYEKMVCDICEEVAGGTDPEAIVHARRISNGLDEVWVEGFAKALSMMTAFSIEVSGEIPTVPQHYKQAILNGTRLRGAK